MLNKNLKHLKILNIFFTFKGIFLICYLLCCIKYCIKYHCIKYCIKVSVVTIYLKFIKQFSRHDAILGLRYFKRYLSFGFALSSRGILFHICKGNNTTNVMLTFAILSSNLQLLAVLYDSPVVFLSYNFITLFKTSSKIFI